MLRPFFDLAMIAPGRHKMFRQAVVAHVLFVSALGWFLPLSGKEGALTTFGYILLSLAMVEASALVGWRLAQLPKSQALEFLLVSPVQPKRVFIAEALVGVSRFALVWLSGLPIFLHLMLVGAILPNDLWPLLALPLVWGIAISLTLTAWVYEPAWVRRIGELFGLLGVLVYLTVGVLAGENLVIWLRELPESLGRALFDSVIFFHTMNPFGVMRYWFLPDAVKWIAEERVLALGLVGIGLIAASGIRAAFRLKGHFHDRHYKPLDVKRESQREPVGERPLSWWAVKRVMEYSGRINLWLAGGFSLMFAAYLIAGEHWPNWMGKLVFQIFEKWGGAPTIATAMAVMAAVPAVFQFGLWDSTVPNRCKRLELLLLTELSGADYWHASLTAAWKRGRGYLFASIVLWGALAISGYATPLQAIAALIGGLALWAFSFAIGFRLFATGNQSNGLASFITLGFPLAVMGLYMAQQPQLAALVPTGLCHVPVTNGIGWRWFVGMLMTVSLTIWLARNGLRNCDADLRKWYDANQGRKSEE